LATPNGAAWQYHSLENSAALDTYLTNFPFVLNHGKNNEFTRQLAVKGVCTRSCSTWVSSPEGHRLRHRGVKSPKSHYLPQRHQQQARIFACSSAEGDKSGQAHVLQGENHVLRQGADPGQGTHYQVPAQASPPAGCRDFQGYQAPQANGGPPRRCEQPTGQPEKQNRKGIRCQSPPGRRH